MSVDRLKYVESTLVPVVQIFFNLNLSLIMNLVFLNHAFKLKFQLELCCISDGNWFIISIKVQNQKNRFYKIMKILGAARQTANKYYWCKIEIQTYVIQETNFQMVWKFRKFQPTDGRIRRSEWTTDDVLMIRITKIRYKGYVYYESILVIRNMHVNY